MLKFFITVGTHSFIFLKHRMKQIKIQNCLVETQIDITETKQIGPFIAHQT